MWVRCERQLLTWSVESDRLRVPVEEPLHPTEPVSSRCRMTVGSSEHGAQPHMVLLLGAVCSIQKTEPTFYT